MLKFFGERDMSRQEKEANRKADMADYLKNGDNIAVKVTNAKKSYGGHGTENSDSDMVLNNLSMNVPKGSIYGLLGPSGCGKTTLLSSVVGRQKLCSGSILIFGAEPGTPKSGVPGRRVGYMPQELALYGEFTTRETFNYFGQLYSMSRSDIKRKTDFLLSFLELPSSGNRLIRQMSGGQQRRVSLAIALIHEPELLILDEPTVGVDPVLRTCIWNHLIEISKNGTPRNVEATNSEPTTVAAPNSMGSSNVLSTTIIITTHYVEEARQADVVGMMRFGRILVEGNPHDLMATFNENSLEQVFLTLCLTDEKVQSSIHSPVVHHKSLNHSSSGSRSQSPTKLECGIVETTKNEPNNDETNPCLGAEVKIIDGEKELKKCSLSEKFTLANVMFLIKFLVTVNISFSSLSAVTIKNFVRMWRNKGFLLFQFVLPALQVSLFCMAIGGEPRNLPFAVVNDEINAVSVGNISDLFVSKKVITNTQLRPFENCLSSNGCILGSKKSSSLMDNYFDFNRERVSNLSCRYLSHIDTDILELHTFDTYEAAYESVKNAHTWGLMHFGSNYSNALVNRIFGLAQLNIPNKMTLEQSDIKVDVDMTNQQIGYIIKMRLAEAFKSFMSDILQTCELDEEMADIAIDFISPPVYGSDKPTFTEFMAPGVILSITYFMAVGLTALAFIVDRQEGLLDRSWVAGVKASEVMFAHVLSQLIVLIVQVGLIIIFMIYVFNLPAKGSLFYIISLTLLQGICGMAFGLVISALCDSQEGAIQLALGSFYPNLLLSGIIWPLESMPKPLSYISLLLPQTYACQAMRGMLSRGWNLEWLIVWRGFVVTLIWIVVLLIMAAVFLRLRR